MEAYIIRWDRESSLSGEKGTVQAIYKYEKGKCYPQADTMFALMELYEANLFDIVCEHEEDCASSSVIYMKKKAA